MSDLVTAIPVVRASVAAILRVRLTRPQTTKRGKLRPAQFQVALRGSAFCAVADRYLVTAFHVLNDGKPRDAGDKFYAFVVPGNAGVAHHFPVINFPVERPDVDIAALEIGPCATAGVRIPAVQVSFALRPDGARVVTVGYPSPEIASVNIGPEGNYLGGNFFLKSHANEGIVSAQYDMNGFLLYELNVGWHHGESGGPIATQADPSAVFSLMQSYRKIQAPHAIVAGPHQGFALSAIQQELTGLGVAGI